MIEKLLDFGFPLFLTWHILRYSKENNIEVPVIIKILKDAETPLEYASYLSFNGYDSFKRLITMCQKKESE